MTWDTIPSSVLCRLLADRYEEEWGTPSNACACGRPARRKFCPSCAHQNYLERNAVRRRKAAA